MFFLISCDITELCCFFQIQLPSKNQSFDGREGEITGWGDTDPDKSKVANRRFL